MSRPNKDRNRPARGSTSFSDEEVRWLEALLKMLLRGATMQDLRTLLANRDRLASIYRKVITMKRQVAKAKKAHKERQQ